MYPQHPYLVIWCCIFICLTTLIWLLHNSVGRFIEIEFIQIICMLPLTGIKLTKDLHDFFSITRYSLFGFPYLDPFRKFKILEGDNQENDILVLLGFENASTYRSISAFLVVVIATSILLLIIIVIVKTGKNCWECWTNIYNKYINFFFLAKFAIRCFLIGWLLICTPSIFEVIHLSRTAITLQIIVPIFILFLWIIWIVFSIWYSLWASNVIFVKIFQELIKEISDKRNIIDDDDDQNAGENLIESGRFAKLFSTIFMIHRILVITCLSPLIDDTRNKIISFAIIQVWYIIYLWIIRPMKTAFAHFMKTYREFWILVLLLLMFGFYAGSDQVA